jgi:hypothetical protein
MVTGYQGAGFGCAGVLQAESEEKLIIQAENKAQAVHTLQKFMLEIETAGRAVMRNS